MITKSRKIIKKNQKALEIKRKQSYNKKSLFVLGVFLCLFFALIFRIGYIQFIKGEEYSTQAYKQQTSSQTISS